MGIDLRDNRGLICGYRLRPEGRAEEVALAPDLAPDPGAGPLWLHFNLNDARARAWLVACPWLAADAREVLVAGDQATGFDSAGNGLVGGLADQYADDPDGFGVLRLYLDQACLITGRRHPLAAVGRLHGDLAGGAALDSPAAVLNQLLRHLVAVLARSVATDAEQVDDAEDRVFAGDYQHARLARHRRAMLRLRRHVYANRRAIDGLVLQPPPGYGKAQIKTLRQIAAAQAAAAQDLDLVSDRARLVSEEIDTRLAERSNQNLYFVSVAAALFLPVTLISGIFGMNVAGLPWLDDPRGFLWALGCMVATVAVALVWLRWRRML